MLVQIECPSLGRTSAVPSIMDSPTLARVERAMLRQEEGAHRTTQHLHQSREAASLNRAALTQVSFVNIAQSHHFIFKFISALAKIPPQEELYFVL